MGLRDHNPSLLAFYVYKRTPVVIDILRHVGLYNGLLGDKCPGHSVVGPNLEALTGP